MRSPAGRLRAARRHGGADRLGRASQPRHRRGRARGPPRRQVALRARRRADPHLQPDLVITQDLCHVCAVSSGDVTRVRSLDADVLALDPRTLAEVAESVRIVARRLGVEERGEAVANDMEARIAATASTVAGAAPVPPFVAAWLDPPFAAGHWLPEMVAAAGGRDVLGRAGQPSFPTI